jgi:hypothetical protein
MVLKTSLLICAAGIAATLLAQDTSSIPNSRGVYYRSDSGWVGLNSTVLMPMMSSTTADLFSVGPKQAVAELPGLHAALQTANVRPTLYVRGFPVNGGIYLVREVQKQDYREIKMPISWQFRDFAHFRSKDLREIEIRSAGNDVLAITPRADLQPGEYALVSIIEPNDRFIKIGYDFGIAGGVRK